VTASSRVEPQIARSISAASTWKWAASFANNSPFALVCRQVPDHLALGYLCAELLQVHQHGLTDASRFQFLELAHILPP